MVKTYKYSCLTNTYDVTDIVYSFTIIYSKFQMSIYTFIAS